MTNSELSRQSGFSKKTIISRLKKGQTEEEILAAAKTRKPLVFSGETFIEAQTRKERALANQHEFKAAQMRGDLVEVVLVNEWIAGMILRSRDILLRMAPELKDRLTHETDPVAVEELLDGEVRRALAELATFKPRKAD